MPACVGAEGKPRLLHGQSDSYSDFIPDYTRSCTSLLRTAWLTTDPGSRAAGWKELGTSPRGEAIFHGVL